MFTLYNTLSRKKEPFVPIVEGRVGLYVCGPTVYGPPHLGHARSAITFDILYRYLLYLGYKVRYVRNITDVGHLVGDADEGEDKVAKLARLQQLEPMEVAQRYTNDYHDAMRALGVLPPSIEPTASGHIIEQIELVRRILDAGYAYVANGSVYFDVVKYSRDFSYGGLSGRKIEDMLEGTRALDGGGDKRSPLDFALWKKASPEHIMRWPSPWSEGFPGWHAECSAMSAKYLGEQFDIHGGGMDLVFPHHEAEIAQNNAACSCGGDSCGRNHKTPVKVGAKYWVHNNMVTVGGQKMGKSLGNAITLEEFFTGNHPLLDRAWSPMVIRFFMLQAHYRSTLDFSNEALAAAEKGLERLMKAVEVLDKLVVSTPAQTSAGSRQPEAAPRGGLKQVHPTAGFELSNIDGLETRLREAMDDDLNTPLAVAALFDWVRNINLLDSAHMHISQEHLDHLRKIFHTWVFDILGLKNEKTTSESKQLNEVIDSFLKTRTQAKANKNWPIADAIRLALSNAGITVKDNKDGTSEWQLQ